MFMVFGFFFQATFGIAAGLGLAIILSMWIYKRFINNSNSGKGGSRC